MGHSHCIHELAAAVLSCIGPTQDRLCQVSSRDMEKAAGALPLTAELLATERSRKKERLSLGVHKFWAYQNPVNRIAQNPQPQR